MDIANAAKPRRPKKLVKDSAATKRWMAYVRSRRSTRKTKSPARKRRTTGRRPGRPRKTSAKTPKRRPRKTSPKKPDKPHTMGALRRLWRKKYPWPKNLPREDGLREALFRMSRAELENDLWPKKR